jgi:hypothetical protein
VPNGSNACCTFLQMKEGPDSHMRLFEEKIPIGANASTVIHTVVAWFRHWNTIEVVKSFVFMMQCLDRSEVISSVLSDTTFECIVVQVK